MKKNSLLVFVLALFFLAGCGGTETETTPDNPDNGGNNNGFSITAEGQGTEGIVMSSDKAQNVTTNSAEFVGNFISLSDDHPVTDYGHVYGTNNPPTVNDMMVAHGGRTETGSFTSIAEGLEEGTTYFFRSFIKNADGEIAYHPNTQTFTTQGESDNGGGTTTVPSCFTQKVVIEQVTGAWCGWCPVGKHQIDLLMQEYDGVIGVEIHQGDELEHAGAFRYIDGAFNVQGFPSGLVNRARSNESGDYAMYPTEFRSNVEEIIADAKETGAEVGIGIDVSEIDQETKRSDVKVKVGFTSDAEGKDYYLTVYLLESGIIGPDQNNYLSGDSRFSNYPYFSLPSVLVDFEHSHVLRRVLSDVEGEKIPSEFVKAGGEFETSFLAGFAAYELENCEIVAIVTTGLSIKSVANAQSVKAGEMQDYD